MSHGFQRFTDFGRELWRPFKVHKFCYDCAESYEGCNAWPASKEMKKPGEKHLRCLDFLRLPDVMPGEATGQVFPTSRMQGRKVPRERTSEKPDIMSGISSGKGREISNGKTMIPLPKPATRGIDPKRHCLCGRPMPSRRRYCDVCREARRRETRERAKQRHPERSHRGSGLPQKAPESAPVPT